MRRPIPARWPAAALVALSATLACGKRSGPLPLCLVETVEPGGSRELAPALWFAHLLPDYARDTARVRQPARDCTGATSTWPTQGPCPLATAAAPALPDRPLGPDDLILQPLGDDRALVWMITTRFADGDGLGPAALVEWLPSGLAVRAVGPLRAPARGPALRLEPLADTSVLVVDAERCAGTEDCRPVTVLVPLVDGRFHATAVHGEGGRCDGPPEIDRARGMQVTAGASQRRFTLTAALRFEAGRVTIDEQVGVVDLDPRRPDDPPRTYRTVASSRQIALVDGTLHDDRPPLWPRVLAQEARVDADAPASAPPITVKKP